MDYIFKCNTSLFCKRILLLFILGLILVTLTLIFSGIYLLYPEVKHFYTVNCLIIECHYDTGLYYDSNEKSHILYYMSFIIEFMYIYNKSFTIDRDSNNNNIYSSIKFCNNTFNIDCYYDDRNIQVSLNINKLRYVLGENVLCIVSIPGVLLLICIFIWSGCYYCNVLPKRIKTYKENKKNIEDKEDKNIEDEVEIKMHT